MKLYAGTKAPDFEIQDIYEKKIRLSDYRGKKIVLGFFRNVSCPFCNMRVHQLMKMKAELDTKDVQMIMLFESHPKIILRSIFHQQISPIPLVGDPERRIYTQWGVERSMMKMVKTMFSSVNRQAMKDGNLLDLPKEKDKDASMTLIPADFLIDENFVIQKAHYGNNLNDHISMQEIKNFALTTKTAAV